MACDNCKILQDKIDELERQLRVLSADRAAKNQQIKQIERVKGTFVSVKEEKQKPSGGFLSALDKLKRHK